LYHGWQQCVSYAIACGLETTIVTNGSLLNDRSIHMLVEAGATIALSVDGCRADTHDLIRGKGSFCKVRAAMRRLAVRSAQQNVIVCFTPTKPNIGELSSVARMLAGEGFQRLYISALENRGRETMYSDELQPGTDDQLRLLIQLAALMLDSGLGIHLDTGHLKYFFSRLLEGSNGLRDPIEGTVRIAPTGEVYLTAYVDSQDFILGTLHDVGLKECWFSERTRYLLAKAGLGAEGMGSCRECPYWIVCGGGSVARAFARTGSFAEPDEFCQAKIRFLDLWYENAPETSTNYLQ
jgi:radical SAM protein with 4Fe4S-binding SPASM domain